MLRRASLCCAVLVALAAPLAGCGKTEKDKYVESFKPLNDKLLRLGNDLGVAVNGAAGEKSNKKVEQRFRRLDSRFRGLRREITALNTPGDLKDESRALTDALGSAQRDVAGIATAAKDSDPQAFQSAATRLVKDAKRVNSSQNALAKATGAKVGAS